MYYEHFGLSGPPFRLAPSPELLFESPGHRRAIALLEQGLKESGGFTLLTGDTGTGKTTLIFSLLRRKNPCLRVSLLTNPKLDFDDILRHALKQFEAENWQNSRLGLLQAFERMLQRLGADERLAMIIDEAQDLSDSALVELRTLSNLANAL